MYGSEELLALLDNAHDKIVVIDDDGTFRYANAATERVIGFEPEELLGTVSFEYVHPDDRDRVRSTFEGLVADEDGATAEVEYRHRTADGEYVWLRSRIANSADERLDGYVVSSTDVSKRRQAEADREEIQSRLREIAANTTEVLWMFDADWSELLFVNDAYEDLWGMSVDELREDPRAFLEGIHPDDRRQVRAAMRELSAGEAVDIEYRIGPDIGYRRWVWVQGRPVFEDGEAVRVTGFVRDVTDRRRREQHLRVIGRLLRHNLRNDLNVIIGQVELLHQRGEVPTDATLESLLDTAESLLDTADKERVIVETLAENEELVRVDLAETVRLAARRVGEDHPNATVSIDIEAGHVVLALPDLVVAVEELLTNAVSHAGTDEPVVSVSAVEEGDLTGIVVADEGPPIPRDEYAVLVGERDIDRLSHGSGLGLWLVHWIAELSNGEVRFEHGPDGGNRVTLLFRRSADEERETRD
ncbi:PAS domain S-box protein [Halobaculum sp. CBA1158]|uniref:PAS domain-containing sensor histidine kinase n=1 Tax=Halobaculum sp. CBA1158 TaxID=2904243 RepID=UPI001F479D3A|nr:PAS domain-containing sensor histidine kinase [Halobaculum sp. CBA1158]UIP00803.1 PAS domain S-box protein [Halobaculum sp. CBA1158]